MKHHILLQSADVTAKKIEESTEKVSNFFPIHTFQVDRLGNLKSTI